LADIRGYELSTNLQNFMQKNLTKVKIFQKSFRGLVFFLKHPVEQKQREDDDSQTLTRVPMLDTSACSCFLALVSLTSFCLCSSSFSLLLAAAASSALRLNTEAWFTCCFSSLAIAAKCLRSYIAINTFRQVATSRVWETIPL